MVVNNMKKRMIKLQGAIVGILALLGLESESFATKLLENNEIKQMLMSIKKSDSIEVATKKVVPDTPYDNDTAIVATQTNLMHVCGCAQRKVADIHLHNSGGALNQLIGIETHYKAKMRDYSIVNGALVQPNSLIKQFHKSRSYQGDGNVKINVK